MTKKTLAIRPDDADVALAGDEIAKPLADGKPVTASHLAVARTVGKGAPAFLRRVRRNNLSAKAARFEAQAQRGTRKTNAGRKPSLGTTAAATFRKATTAVNYAERFLKCLYEGFGKASAGAEDDDRALAQMESLLERMPVLQARMEQIGTLTRQKITELEKSTSRRSAGPESDDRNRGPRPPDACILS